MVIAKTIPTMISPRQTLRLRYVEAAHACKSHESQPSYLKRYTYYIIEHSPDIASRSFLFRV